MSYTPKFLISIVVLFVLTFFTWFIFNFLKILTSN